MGRQHAAAIESEPSVTLSAVIDPSPTVGRFFAARGTEVRPELKSTDLSGVDAVVVAAPTRHHLPLLAEVLPTGLPVLCEKPCALDAGQFTVLRQLVAGASGRVAVGFWRRHSASFNAARAYVQADEIGMIRAMVALQLDAAPPELSFQSTDVTGGIGLDCGVHETDTALWLTGADGFAAFRTATPQSRLSWVPANDADTMAAQAELGSGAVMSSVLTRTAGGEDRIDWLIVGDRGSIRVEIGSRERVTLSRLDGTTTTDDFSGDPVHEALRSQLRSLWTVGAHTSAGVDDAWRAALPWLPT